MLERMVARPNRWTALAAACVAMGLAPRGLVGAAHSAEARITVKERTVDLGRLKEGNKGTAKFLLENHGDAVLHIERVFATCGCTVPKKLSPEDARVQPGESLEIEAVFDTKGRRGRQRKTVTVLSNDPAEPELKLFLTAEVVALFEVLVKDRPSLRMAFGKHKPGDAVEEVIDLLPTEPGSTLSLVSLDIRHAALTYETEATTRDDREGVRVKLAIDPDASVGPVSTSLLISAKVGDERADSSLALSGEVVGVLAFSPATIKRLQPALPGTSLPPVSVSSDLDHPFDVLLVDGGPNIEATAERQSPYSYRIKLRIAESASPGPFGQFLDIRTSVVEQPLVRIPVYAAVRPRVQVEPPFVVLQSGLGKHTSRLVKIASSSNDAMELGTIVTESPYITVEPAESPGRKSKTFKHLRISAGGDAPVGIHQAVVRVTTGLTGQREVLIPVTLLVR